MIQGEADALITEMKGTVNVVHSNHPLNLGKVIFHKAGPWCQKSQGQPG